MLKHITMTYHIQLAKQLRIAKLISISSLKLISNLSLTFITTSIKGSKYTSENVSVMKF